MLSVRSLVGYFTLARFFLKSFFSGYPVAYLDPVKHMEKFHSTTYQRINVETTSLVFGELLIIEVYQSPKYASVTSSSLQYTCECREDFVIITLKGMFRKIFFLKYSKKPSIAIRMAFFKKIWTKCELHHTFLGRLSQFLEILIYVTSLRHTLVRKQTKAIMFVLDYFFQPCSKLKIEALELLPALCADKCRLGKVYLRLF